MLTTLLSGSKIYLLIYILSRGHFTGKIRLCALSHRWWVYLRWWKDICLDYWSFLAPSNGPLAPTCLSKVLMIFKMAKHLYYSTILIQNVHMNFNKHWFDFGREFHLLLKPDVKGFTEDFKIQSEDETQTVDLSHIYSGVVEGTFCSTFIVLNATQFLSIINVTKMKLFLS